MLDYLNKEDAEKAGLRAGKEEAEVQLAEMVTRVLVHIQGEPEAEGVATVDGELLVPLSLDTRLRLTLCIANVL